MIIVAGIARSGLSLTMQMLSAAGFPCLGEPPAFEPFSLGEIPWEELDKGTGVVKLVDSHLHLPPPGDYDVIRLHRDRTEQAKSTIKWVKSMMPIADVGNFDFARLFDSFDRDYAVIDEWANKHRCLALHFEDLILNTLPAARRLCEWCKAPKSAYGMASCVVTRGAECYDGLLELSLMERYDAQKEENAYEA